MSPSLLITRPAPDGAALADAARTALGAEVPVVLSPLLRIERRAAPCLPDHTTLILTSRHALFAAPRGHAACVVGPRLTDLAREAGLNVVRSAPDAATLLAGLRADPPATPLLHLRGAHVAADISGLLNAAGIACDVVTVYDQPPQPLTPEAKQLLAKEAPVIVPLMSPRTARLFVEASPHTAPLVFVALSDAVASMVPGALAHHLRVAQTPDLAALLAELPAAWDVATRVEGGLTPK